MEFPMGLLECTQSKKEMCLMFLLKKNTFALLIAEFQNKNLLCPKDYSVTL